MLTSPQVVVAGHWLSAEMLWGDLTLRNRWPYGCWEATWNVVLKPYQRPPALAIDAAVEVRLGSGVIWAGNLSELDWETGAMTAVGAARQGETSLCLTSGGSTTATPNTAVDQAIARGSLGWTRRMDLGSTPLPATDTTAQLNYVTALLDAYTLAQNKRWGVNAQREVYTAADPTVPAIYMRPGAGVLGTADEKLAGTVYGRYQDTTGNLATVSVGSGRPEVGVWLGAQGYISGATATNLITGIRGQLQARAGWTNGVTVTAEQVTTPGGQRLGLDQVVAGKMARLLGLRDERGASASTDIVLAETFWDVTAGTVQCNPVGLSDRSLSGVIESVGGELL